SKGIMTLEARLNEGSLSDDGRVFDNVSVTNIHIVENQGLQVIVADGLVSATPGEKKVLSWELLNSGALDYEGRLIFDLLDTSGNLIERLYEISEVSVPAGGVVYAQQLLSISRVQPGDYQVSVVCSSDGYGESVGSLSSVTSLPDVRVGPAISGVAQKGGVVQYFSFLIDVSH